MKLVGYRSPGRKATAQKLRAIAENKPTAINCPELFATDKEFMRLFWASKAIEHDRRQQAKFARLKNELRARGIYLESLKEKSDAA